MPELLPPQLVVNCRMMFLSYLPGRAHGHRRRAACRSRASRPWRAAPPSLVHYVVDRDEQTSGFGAYSLSYICFDVVGHDADAETPGALGSATTSSPRPACATTPSSAASRRATGVTTLAFEGRHPGCDGHRRRAAVDPLPRADDRRGRRDHRRSTDGAIGARRRVMRNRHAVIMERAKEFEMQSISFLDSDHPIHPFRPREPLELVFGFPRAARVVLLPRRYRGPASRIGVALKRRPAPAPRARSLIRGGRSEDHEDRRSSGRRSGCPSARRSSCSNRSARSRPDTRPPN